MPIRAATPADGPALAEIYRPFVEGSAVSFESTAPDAAEMSRRVEARGDYPWLVVEEQGRVLGYAYASAYRPRAAYRYTCEVTIYLDDGARGRGLGRALYGALFDALVAQGLANAYAVIADPDDNVASVGLHTALGFAPVGRLPRAGWKAGAWHDVAIYARRLQEGEPPE